jgi:hypothetical protein
LLLAAALLLAAFAIATWAIVAAGTDLAPNPKRPLTDPEPQPDIATPADRHN